MRRMTMEFVLMLALGMVAGSASGQGPIKDLPLHPPDPPDTTRMHQQADQARDAAFNTTPLKITFGKKSAEWTRERLAALPHETVTVFNERTKSNQTYTGVPLIVLIGQLGVPEKPNGKQFRLYLVAEGADGFKAVYSIGEITAYVHDAMVLVADMLDDKPLMETGPLQLVSTGEKRPDRWVRNIVSIRVLSAD